MTERGPQSGESRRPTLDELLDRADAAAEVELRTQADPELRRQLAVQSQLDDSLNRLFDAPDIQIRLPVSRAPRARWMPWGIAAALVMAVLGVWWFGLRSPARDVLSPLYRDVVAAGFKPETVCTTDEEFANWCRGYLNQPIYPVDHPTGLELVGWDIAPTIGYRSAVLLAKVEGEPVIVVMNRRERQSVRPKLGPQGPLHVFEARLGDVVLYEVTPKDKEVILPTLSATPRH